jgi:hypothetical protein
MTLPISLPRRYSTPPAGLYRARTIFPAALEYTLFFPSVWLVAALGHSLQLIGAFFALIPVALCLAYAVLRQTAPPRLLAMYIAFCILIAFLSRYRIMPESWQVHFVEEAILRQLAPTVAFFAVAWASKAYFQRSLARGHPFFGAPIFLCLSLIVAPLVMFQQDVRYQGEDPASTALYLYGSFMNNIIIAMFFVTASIFLTKDWRRYGGLLLVLGIALTSPLAQFKVVAAILFLVFLGVPGRIVAVCVVASLTIAYLVGINFIPQAIAIDPNTGIRLAFTSDALSSMVDTYGLGIGFGKESVRWRYQFPGMDEFTFLPDPRNIPDGRMLELLSTGIHNSFFQSLMRTGVIGFGLLVTAFFAAFPPRRLPRQVRNHAAVMFAMIFLALFVNPPLESPIQVVGVAFVYGYLIALRASTHGGPGAHVQDERSWCGVRPHSNRSRVAW